MGQPGDTVQWLPPMVQGPPSWGHGDAEMLPPHTLSAWRTRQQDMGGEWRALSLPSQSLQGVGKGSLLLCFRGRLKGQPLVQSCSR